MYGVIAGLWAGAGLAYAAAPAVGSKSEPPKANIVLCDAVRTQGGDDESDPLVRGEQGWIFRTADLAPTYALDAASLAALTRFVANWKARGTTVALLLLAPRGYFGAAYVDRADPLAAGFDPVELAKNYAAAVASLRSTGALVPDLVKAADADADAVGEKYYFDRDFHWRPEAAKSAMGTLAKLATEAGLKFAPSTWTSTLVRQRAHAGAIAKRVEQDCKVAPYPAERFPWYVSGPQNVGTKEGSAASGEPTATPGALTAQVVLAGSSHTNKGGEDLMNTTGWLREALQTDVLNVGVDGGGYSTGLLRWMDSPTARAQPPKLLSIEMSARIPQNFPTFMRSAIPAMYGDCAAPVATGKVTLNGQAAPVLYVPAGTRSGGSYLVVDSSDPAMLQFTMSFTLETGEEEFLPIQHSSLVPNTGRFFVEAPLSKLNLAGVRIDAGKASRATLSSRLCALPPDEVGVRSLGAK